MKEIKDCTDEEIYEAICCHMNGNKVEYIIPSDDEEDIKVFERIRKDYPHGKIEERSAGNKLVDQMFQQNITKFSPSRLWSVSAGGMLVGIRDSRHGAERLKRLTGEAFRKKEKIEITEWVKKGKKE